MSEPLEIRKLDESVVNRIAAGEIIQRPSNALKELLENSLDAKSTNIQITIKNGGLKLLQIQDNGTGIRKEDFDIVCERFTTSKLRTFEDLQSIGTYGFRGEALASISHVAHLTIVSKTSKDICAYKASYIDGKPQGKPKPIAGNQGTIITVEDLFYNMNVRRAALRNSSEEYQKVSGVVSKYAIHNPKVGFSLKKSGGNNDVKTPSDSTCIENIRNIYGSTIARELVEFSLENQPFRFKASGYFTNLNYFTKNYTFILFINHRLVDCQGLKKSIDLVYTTYLPKNMHPFVYLSLEVDPATLDVNVHPTKHEVQVLNQSQIAEAIVTELEAKLLASNTSRMFYTQAKLPSIHVECLPLKDDDEDSKNKSLHPKDKVRTDSTAQKLEKFFGAPIKKTDTHTNNDREKKDAKVDVSITEEDFQKHNKEFLEKIEQFENILLNKTVSPHNVVTKEQDNKDLDVMKDVAVIEQNNASIGSDENNRNKDNIIKHDICRPSTSKANETITSQNQDNVIRKDNETITSKNNEVFVNKNNKDDFTEMNKETVTSSKDDYSEHIACKYVKSNSDECLSKDLSSKETRVETQLTSVLELRKVIEDDCHRSLRELYAHHVYVGAVSPEQALIQHSTSLYLCQTKTLLKELFYQFVLHNFQNFSGIEFAEPLPLKDLILLALEDPETGWTEEDGDKGELADNAVALLSEKSEMLNEYFSVEIVDGNLKAIPQLLEFYFPNEAYIPLYVLRLATDVNWETEKECFETFARETALFYSKIDTHSTSGDNDWKWVTEHVLYPAIKDYFIPPKSFISNASILEIAKLSDLYKVFERC